MIRQKAAGAAQPRRCCGRPGWLRPCVRTNLCRGRCLHRPANLAALQTRVGADSISARFAAVGAVLASLVKGRWPSEARTEGLLRREMPLAEGSARFGGAPGGGIWGRGNPPVCGLCPQTAPFDKGACSVRGLGAARTGGLRLPVVGRGGPWPSRGCSRRREGCGRDESRPYKLSETTGQTGRPQPTGRP